MKRAIVLKCCLAAVLSTEVSCSDTTKAGTFDGQVLLTDHGAMFKPRHREGPGLIKICSSSGQLKPLMDFEMGDRVDVRFEGVDVRMKGRLDECGIDVQRFIRAHRNDKS